MHIHGLPCSISTRPLKSAKTAVDKITDYLHSQQEEIIAEQNKKALLREAYTTLKRMYAAAKNIKIENEYIVNRYSRRNEHRVQPYARIEFNNGITVIAYIYTHNNKPTFELKNVSTKNKNTLSVIKALSIL